MDRRKIVIVTNLFPNEQERTRGLFIEQLVERLRAHFDITIIAPRPWQPAIMTPKKRRLPKAEIYNGLQVYRPRHLVIPKVLRLSYGVFLFIRLLPLIRRLKKQGRCDAVSAHWLYPDGVASAWAASCLKLPVFLHCLGCDINEYSKYFWRRIQIRYAMKRAAAVITKSNALAMNVSDLGISREKIHVVPNGLDRSRFKPGNREEARTLLAIQPDEFVLLYVGNFNVEKNVDTLIRAFAAAIADRKSPAGLYLIGDGPERASLLKLVTGLGVEDSVRFLGRKSHTEITSYYHAANYLGLPSLREGCPNVVLEALGSGLPVIASNVGGVPEIVNDSLGVLVPPTDHASWAARLTELMNAPPKTITSFTWPSWENNAAEIADIFESGMRH